MAFATQMPLFVLFLAVLISLQPSAQSAPQVPCFFIFGDSLVDPGNNNQLTTLAKVNYLPYGIDFPLGPTGRFTNGRTTADVLAIFYGNNGCAAELLGFDNYIPPSASAQGKDIIKGVNYASGGAGIRSETGQILGERITLDEQLLNHKLTISRIANLLGNHTSAKDHLGTCLYYFVIGSNDYINNYFLPQYYNTSSIYTPEEYATVLVQQYSQQLKTLYSFGARKVSVSGLGPVGCTPQELGRGTNGSACVDFMNKAVQLFNDKLKILVEELNNSFKDAKFIYSSAMDIRPSELIALVDVSIMRTKPPMILRQKPCPVRALHLFYDGFHPTDIVNKIIATTAYGDILKLSP
ncbi:Triacylglycerol lipase [Handroanthus impetiginosus]|uniref:Triacylglycerol lipase n=1 Tax=Handroanthus impetiginosus TaxID=429701 RepID=A0A2G9GAX4_9LAMI|nr:Triacylglycerol lipase [Handroanthus impetiginosus]